MADAWVCDAHINPPAQKKGSEAHGDQTSESSNYLKKPILDAGVHKFGRSEHAV